MIESSTYVVSLHWPEQCTGTTVAPTAGGSGALGPPGATAPVAGCLTSPTILSALLKTSGTRFISKEFLFSVQNIAVKKMAKLVQARE